MQGNVPSSGGSLLLGQIALSLLSLGLLVFTSILSYYSYSAQARTSVRESLEQLDDIELDRYKLKPILHRFEFGPLNPKSVLLMKVYDTKHDRPDASVPETATDHLDEDDIEEIADRLNESELGDDLEDSYIDEDGIYFEIATRNAVAVRRFANIAMTEIRDLWLD